MFTHLLRLALFTIFWSLLAWFAFFLFADAMGPPLTIRSEVIFAAILFIVMGLGVAVGLNVWTFLGGARGMVVSAVEPIWTHQRDGLVVLAYLDQAIRMNAPFSPLLEAAAKTEGGRLAWRLNNLREMLDVGVDLSTAIERQVPEVSDRAVAIISAAERTGQLRPALGRLLAEADRSLEPPEYDTRFALAYILMMLAAMTIAVVFLNVFVVPKFEVMFRDFHVVLPAVTQCVLTLSFTAGPALGIAALAIFVIWLIYGLIVLIFRPRGAPRTLWDLFRYLASFLPFVGASQRDLSWADVCRTLADSFAAGWPAVVAMEQARHLVLVPPVRAAVRRWNGLVQTGIPLSPAAVDAGLPRIMVGILTTSGDQTAPALNFLARYYTNRFSRMRILLRGALAPVIVICFAICVATIALSVFMPLIELVNHLAGWVAHVQ